MDARHGIGGNSGNTSPLLESTPNATQALEAKLRKIMTLYNAAANDKRNASETLLEAKKKFKLENADFVRGIDETIRVAREELDEELQRIKGFEQTKEDKKDASRRMREALKLAKEFGLDVPAFKKMLQMSAMDAVEREEHFDNIDLYCKAARLWGGVDF